MDNTWIAICDHIPVHVLQCVYVVCCHIMYCLKWTYMQKRQTKNLLSCLISHLNLQNHKLFLGSWEVSVFFPTCSSKMILKARINWNFERREGMHAMFIEMIFSQHASGHCIYSCKILIPRDSIVIISWYGIPWDYGDECLFSWVCCQLQQVFLCCGSSSARYRINHNDCYKHILVYFPVSQCHINFHGVSQGCYSDVIKLYTEINWYGDWN